MLRGMFWTWITVRKNVLKIVHIEIDLHTATEGASCDGGYDNKGGCMITGDWGGTQHCALGL